MSWAEIKKAINTDLTEPLNYLAWINDLATFGTDSYVYKQPSIMDELATNSLNASLNFFSFVFLIDGYADKVFTKITGDTTGAFDGLTTMELVAEDETAMTAIVASETAITAVIASETAITAVAASETAMTAIVASETAVNAVIGNDQALYSIAVNNDTGLGLSKLASGIEGMATTAWENNTKWGTIKSTLDASSLFTKSELLIDNGGTKDRTGNLITLIESAYSNTHPENKISITPRYTGCYAHAYTNNWSTGKHIMWGGHSSTHQGADPGACYVKYYMYTPII